MSSSETSIKTSFFRQHKNVLFIFTLLFLWVTFSLIEFFFYERSSIILIAVRNLNIIFALVLALLIGKNFIRLYFERSRKFRTKLITVFLAWSLIPSIILFYVASGHIKGAIDKWFRTDVKKQVENIKYVNEDLYSFLKNHVVHFSREISTVIREQSLLNVDNELKLKNLMKEKLEEYNLSAIQVFTALGDELYRGRTVHIFTL